MMEEDPFGEFLSQEQGAHGDRADAPQDDAALQLKSLVESSQRQELLLGKMCSLLAGIGDKLGEVTNSQERLEAAIQQAGLGSGTRGGGAQAPPPAGGAAAGAPSRGAVVAPPGRGGPPVEDPRASAEKLAQDRARMEEENLRRAEELRKKKIEDDRRKAEEAERQRVEDERKRTEERQRKANLEAKTTGLMSDLISGGGGGGSDLFGSDPPKKTSKGGLFDDD